MSVKEKIFSFCVSPLQKALSVPSRVTAKFIENVDIQKSIVTPYGDIQFSTNNSLAYSRAKSLLTKEPDTIAWIDSFQLDDIFYDIGANVGVFSLYAAKKNIQTFSFEPESQNYALLCKNIYINHFDKKIKSLNVALSDKTALENLYLASFGGGYALHNLADSIDFNKKKFNSVMQQAVCAFTLDEFIEKFNLPRPTHIKIDVDGLEKEVIDGARATIKNDSTRSILIELNKGLESDCEIETLLKAYGYTAINQHQKPNKNESYKNIYNCIFSRD